MDLVTSARPCIVVHLSALRVAYFLSTDPIPEKQSFTISDKLINDASGLNETVHSGVVKLPADLNQSIFCFNPLWNRLIHKERK